MGFHDESFNAGNNVSVYDNNIVNRWLWAFKMSLLMLAITFLCTLTQTSKRSPNNSKILTFFLINFN